MSAVCIFLLHYVDKNGAEVRIYTAQFKNTKELKQGFPGKYPGSTIITFENVTHRFFPK
jgi:hypothetical protein